MAAIVAWPLERNRGNYEQSDTRDMWAAPPEEGGGGAERGRVGGTSSDELLTWVLKWAL